MKKEQLEKLGLTEEQIAGVFKLNGQDIENLKADKVILEKEKSNLETQLSAANEKISGFGDYDNIKSEVEKWKNDYEDLKSSSENEINNLKLNYSIENSLVKSKVKNSKAAKALLDLDALRDSKNFDDDLNTQIDNLKKSDSYLFEAEGSSVSGANSVNEPSTKDMTYSQMMEYLEKNPGAKI